MGYIARLTGFALKHKKLYFAFLLFAGLGTIFNILAPLVLVQIIDTVIYGGQYDLLVPNLMLYISLAVMYAICDVISRYGAAIASQNVIYDLRRTLYESLMDKDLSFYDDEETGQILARVTTDITMVREFMYWGYRVIFVGLVTMIGVYIAMYSLSPELTLYMFALIPVIIIFIYVFAKRVRPVFYASRKQFGVLSSVLAENIVGMKVVQSYASADRENARVEKENKKFLDLRVEAFRLFALYRPFLPTMFGLVTGFLIFIGGYSFILGDLTLGTFVGFISLVGMMMLPARFLSWGVGMYQRASAAAERAFYILDHKDQVNDPEVPVDTPIKGKVTFDNVYFSYLKDSYILQEVSMTVEQGQMVALLGGTGSGKTSLVNLMPRFYDADTSGNITYQNKTYRVDEKGIVKINDNEYEIIDDKVIIDDEEYTINKPGRVYIDDIDVRFYGLEALRSSIGMVHQDPFLFSASIQENIAFAKPEATIEQVQEAAKAAMIHDFIMTLDGGYDSHIGERGVTLSGGQKQRIAIARALLADPKILILDDSTSSVDAKTEMMIQKALDNLMKGRTTFIITHRLSTVRNADLIVMMERGRIVEIGSHEELIQQAGLYNNINETLEAMEIAAEFKKGGSDTE